MSINRKSALVLRDWRASHWDSNAGIDLIKKIYHGNRTEFKWKIKLNELNYTIKQTYFQILVL